MQVPKSALVLLERPDVVQALSPTSKPLQILVPTPNGIFSGILNRERASGLVQHLPVNGQCEEPDWPEFGIFAKPTSKMRDIPIAQLRPAVGAPLPTTITVYNLCLDQLPGVLKPLCPLERDRIRAAFWLGFAVARGVAVSYSI
jgi:hypothetical protein